MSNKRQPLRHAAARMVGAVLLISALVAVAIAIIVYQIAFERQARERSTRSVAEYQEKLLAVERQWADHLAREKRRLEFSRLLESPANRWEPLRAYLAALSDSPFYAGVALCDANRRLLFREKQASGCVKAEPATPQGQWNHYFTDAAGNLFAEREIPISLGPDGRGYMRMARPLDHAFLRSHAFPDTELFIEWQGRLIASSDGEAGLARGRTVGYSGSIDRDGERFEQRWIDFPLSADPPRLLIQTRIVPPLSIVESVGLAIGVFVVLAVLLSLALRGWLARLVPRIEKLNLAAHQFAFDGKSSPILEMHLRQARGGGIDELGDVAEALHEMIADLAQRDQQRREAELLLRESEQRFRDVAEFSGEFVWEIDKNQTIAYISDGAAEVFGRPVRELIGSNFLDYLPAEERGPMMENVRAKAFVGEPFRRLEATIVRPDGSRSVLLFSGTPVTGADGRRTGSYRGLVIDATQQYRDRESLRLAEKVFLNSAQAILITDPATRIITVNPAFTKITGYRLEEAVCATPAKFASGRHDKAFFAAMWKAINEEGTWSGELWDRRKNGEIYPKWLTINAVHDPESKAITHYVGIFSDITEQKENEARIAQLAYRDALTGLPNRFAFNAHLAQSLAEARRNGAKLALMFIDLDRFKTINDSLGHDVGDQLLIAVAQRIRSVLRESDTAARLGGDEFVIIVTGIDGPEDAVRVAEKVIAGINEPLVLAGHTLRPSPSIGIGIYPTDGHEAEILLKNADAAMYYAKQHGRNQFHFFTADMNAAASERLLLETQLHRALERREFVLMYQPQVEIASGRVVGVEALVRWQHPDRGMIHPDEFVSIAEDTGLIVQLGMWVLEEACRQLVLWGKAAEHLRVAVNLSAHQFRDRQLVERITATLAQTGLPAERLELEITESVLMDNPEAAIEILRSFADRGVHLAIDDFGTGYSSLSYLKRLPTRRLKIDRSFVMDLEVDPNDVAITRGIIALANTLGLSVTAEGIETEAQLAMLRDFRCAEGQGYLFSEPLAPDALYTFLTARHPPVLVASAAASRQLH